MINSRSLDIDIGMPPLHAATLLMKEKGHIWGRCEKVSEFCSSASYSYGVPIVAASIN